MAHFPITKNVEEALQQAVGSRRDDLGYCYHTFSIRLSDSQNEWQGLLSELVDAGWKLQGTPVVVEATDAAPRYVLIAMLHAEPHPLEIRGEVRIRGEINGGGDLRGRTFW